MTIFSAPRPEPLRTIRTAEDLFALAGYGAGLEPSARALERVRMLVREAPFIETALAARTVLMPGARGGRRLGFRVIARITGAHEFRRVDFQREVERGIGDRTDHLWRLEGDGAELEFWATLIDGEFFLALRLSGERMRIREYKVAHRPGSLRPSVAAALAWLTHPRDDDIVLDPMCGAGTIPIERAHIGRYAMMLGFDQDREQLDAAIANVGPRYKPIGLGLADAARMPLGNASISAIATNLPWGTRHGSHAGNRALYPRIIAEFKRVVRPGGTIVMLTAEAALMHELTRRGLVKPARTIRVSILGAPATIYVCPA